MKFNCRKNNLQNLPFVVECVVFTAVTASIGWSLGGIVILAPASTTSGAARSSAPALVDPGILRSRNLGAFVESVVLLAGAPDDWKCRHFINELLCVIYYHFQSTLIIFTLLYVLYTNDKLHLIEYILIIKYIVGMQIMYCKYYIPVLQSLFLRDFMKVWP